MSRRTVYVDVAPLQVLESCWGPLLGKPQIPKASLWDVQPSDDVGHTMFQAPTNVH